VKSNLLPKKGNHWREVSLFIAFAIAFMFFLFRHPRDRHQPDFVASSALSQLRSRFLKDGIEGYLEEKRALRTRIENTIKSEDEDSDVAVRATRIATYLFPEVLPDTNFEKPIARDAWQPLEKQIEQEPRSVASRQSFEELRATIWNYESPDRKSPEISEDASQVIRVYDTLSAP